WSADVCSSDLKESRDSARRRDLALSKAAPHSSIRPLWVVLHYQNRLSSRDIMQEVSLPRLENHGKDASVAHPAEDRTTSVPDKEGLIVRSPEFIDLETPVEYFNTWLTPEQHFFVRNHMHEPSISAAWSLSVSGIV